MIKLKDRLVALGGMFFCMLCFTISAEPSPLESYEISGQNPSGIEVNLSVLELTNEGIPNKLQLVVKNSNTEFNYVVTMPNESNSPTMLIVLNQNGAVISKTLNTVLIFDSDEHPPSMIDRQLRPGETARFTLNMSDYLEEGVLDGVESVTILFVGRLPYSKSDDQAVESIRLRHTLGPYILAKP